VEGGREGGREGGSEGKVDGAPVSKSRKGGDARRVGGREGGREGVPGDGAVEGPYEDLSECDEHGRCQFAVDIDGRSHEDRALEREEGGREGGREGRREGGRVR